MVADIGHIPIKGSPPPINIAQDAVDAQRSVALRQLLNRAVQLRAAKANQLLARDQQVAKTPPPITANAAGNPQVSSAEQSMAVGLRGREIDDKKLSGKFRDYFKLMTTGDERFLELSIHSMIKALAGNTRSLVDDLVGVSPDDKLIIKFLLLQIAILDAGQYALTDDETRKLISQRDSILASQNKNLDEFLMSAAVSSMSSKQLKIGVKQLTAANRLLSKNENQGTLELYGFLSTLLTSNPKNLAAKLKALRGNWELLQDRERTQYPLELTAQRQHFIQSRIRQIDLVMQSLGKLDQIGHLCVDSGVKQVPESGKVLLEMIGVVSTLGVGSVNRFNRLFEAMLPAARGTQIYCVNLKNLLQSGLIFITRHNEKTYFQLVQTTNNLLTGSYVQKPVDPAGAP